MWRRVHGLLFPVEGTQVKRPSSKLHLVSSKGKKASMAAAVKGKVKV
jgi:hypothetical protein